MTLKLHTFWSSSSSWRVRIALAYKAVAHEVVTVDLRRGEGDQHEAPFRVLNPMAQVPLLEIHEAGAPPRRLAQSVAIVEYLEERFPEPPLLPRDPFARARARQLAEIVNSGIQPQQNLEVLKRVKRELHADEQAWARSFIERGLAAIEALAPDTAGTFLVGDAPSVADVFLVPQLAAARRFGVDLAPLGTLTRVEAACAALPAFAAAAPERQPDAPRLRG
jgi:maleylacetoacetate isomerase